MAKKKPITERLAPKGARYFEFEEGYRVYRDGTVWREAADGSWNQLSGTKRGKTRVIVTAKRRTASIATLVLEAFVGPRPPRMVPRHRDGDPENNRVENVYWGPKPGARGLTREEAQQVWDLHSEEGLDADAIAEKLEIEGTGPIRMLLNGYTWNDITGLSRTSKRSGGVLNESLVRKIMKLADEKLTPLEIAVKLGLGQRRTGLVDRVLNGVIWNHVTGIPRGGRKDTE